MSEGVESPWISVVQNHLDCNVKFFSYDARHVKPDVVKYRGNGSGKGL